MWPWHICFYVCLYCLIRVDCVMAHVSLALYIYKVQFYNSTLFLSVLGVTTVTVLGSECWVWVWVTYTTALCLEHIRQMED